MARLISVVKRWAALGAVVVVMVAVSGLAWIAGPDGLPAHDAATASRSVAPPEPEIEPAPALVTPAGTETAPDFRGIARWLNSEPLTMEEQRGKVVLIDFWTYS